MNANGEKEGLTKSQKKRIKRKGKKEAALAVSKPERKLLAFRVTHASAKA